MTRFIRAGAVLLGLMTLSLGAIADQAGLPRNYVIETMFPAQSPYANGPVTRWWEMPRTLLVIGAGVTEEERTAINQVFRTARDQAGFVFGGYQKTVAGASLTDAEVDAVDVVLVFDRAAVANSGKRYFHALRSTVDDENQAREVVASAISSGRELMAYSKIEELGRVTKSVAIINTDGDPEQVRALFSQALLVIANPTLGYVGQTELLLETVGGTKIVSSDGYSYLRAVYDSRVKPGDGPAQIWKILNAE